MSRQRPLYGSCSCGRNHYSIIVPTSSTQSAQVYLDNSSENRRSLATPLTAWLRIPLPWFTSTTYSQFPDETHSSIRRTYTPFHLPHCKRVFCGYCGTHLSYWSEETREEAEYLNVTLGSLRGEDIRALKELGLLEEDVEVEGVGMGVEAPNGEHANAGEETREGGVVQTSPTTHQMESAASRTVREGRSSDLDWFEELISGSALSLKPKTRRGIGVSSDGSTTVQWEVSEWTEGDSESSVPSSAKRKLGELSSDDVNMRG